MGLPIIDALSDEVPTPLTLRTAKAPPNQLATYRFPADRRLSESSRWFDNGGEMQPVRTGNEVEYLIDGAATFAEMARAIKAASGPGSFIYALAWTMFLDFPFADDGATLGQLLDAASKRGVQIRAMIWKPIPVPIKNPTFNQNDSVIRRINDLPTGQGILDSRVLGFGAHHQKVFIVQAAGVLTAFCGGIDVNPDRVFPKGMNGAEQDGGPMHDVHCRIRGPAAFDVLNTFVQRWRDNVRAFSVTEKAPLVGLGVTADQQPKPGRLHVQIARTFGNPARGFSSSPNASPREVSPYDFAPKGERSIRAMYLRAIRAARRFIYIEDQYLVNPETSAELVKALPNISHLTVLIPHSSISDMPRVNELRKNFIGPLKRADKDKVRVFVKSPFGATVPHSYVHAKTWVFDDQYAIIGSANNNLRGWTHDSELCAGIYDESTNNKASYTFAHRMRIALWAEHLNMNTPAGHAQLADGVASSVHWTFPGTNVASFDENAGLDTPSSQQVPLFAIDPDGT